MFKKLLIIGCGLIGSSLLRASINKKISRQILGLEKSKKYKKQIKNINSKIIECVGPEVITFKNLI